MDQNDFDEYFSRALASTGEFEHGGSELIASGVLIFRTVDMTSENVSYGFATYGGELPLHEIIGMLELTKASAMDAYRDAVYEDLQDEDDE